MCGLVGIIALEGLGVDRGQLDEMVSMIHHRGPDSCGFWHDEYVGLGFRRLSILDLSEAANQPMTSADGRYTIVFNGEIYNFVELRTELQDRGYGFRTSGDTEVLLNAFIEWGIECLPKLNGMWAFLIYDSVNKVVFGSRDRFGIKPLFYYRGESHILFASEIKSIRANTNYSGDVNWSIAADFLLRGRLDFNQRTFFTGIEKVPPGTAFQVGNSGNMSFWNYWELPRSEILRDPDPCDKYRALFSDAVRLQLRSDVPLGVFLSGGLDSTSIICEMARLSSVNGSSQLISAFSFMHDEFDETQYIADTLSQVRVDLKRCTTDPVELWHTISKILWYHDEPVHSMTAVIGFELSKLARQAGIKVVLNGQGADETTAGYASYFRNYWHSLLTNLEVRKAWREIGIFTSAFGGSQPKQFANSVLNGMRAQCRRMRTYRTIAGRRQFRADLGHPWFESGLKANLEFEEPQCIDPSLNSQLMHSVSVSPLPLYLRIEDRNTMAHGVEARLPFLDYRLVSFLFSIGDDWKMRGHWNKYILRSAMEDRIPASVRLRKDKMGFPSPSRQWFADTLFEMAWQILSDGRTRDRGLFNTAKILADLRAHRDGAKDISAQLFNVLQFEIWMRTLVDHGQKPLPADRSSVSSAGVLR